MATVQMNAAGVGGLINFQATGPVVVPTSGLISINTLDVPDALRMGCTYVNQRSGQQVVGQGINSGARPASAGRLIASTSLAAGTLSIANQPDFPRQADMVITAGTSAVTAGTLTLSYRANDSTNQVDVMSVVTAASGTLTTRTTKGVVTITSAIVTGVAGGASPAIQLNDTNALSMLVDPGFQSFSVIKETVNGANETVGTVASSAASVTPTTTPATTNIYSFGYTFTSPSS